MGDAEGVVDHPTKEQLEAGLGHVLQSPKDNGPLVKLVRRPDVNRREVVSEGELDVDLGLSGDNWKVRANPTTPDGKADPVAQVTVMNARFLSLIAQSEERWELSGDQLLIDLDLSIENLPPGTRLRVGSAVIELSKKPHTGCAKFAARFGQDALQFVSTPEGRARRLRGANAKVVQSGAIRVGDEAVKLPPAG